MELAEQLTRWSALTALFGATVTLCCRLSRLSVPESILRGLWAASCVIFLIHVGCAFQFYHHWSHADAYEATAVRTRETVGVNTGAGLHLNYLFTAAWLADVAWWWTAPASHHRQPRWLTWTLAAFFGFMAINATIVFGGTAARWVGGGCAVLIVFAVVGGLQSRCVAN
jgi:hypothetical protein